MINKYEEKHKERQSYVDEILKVLSGQLSELFGTVLEGPPEARIRIGGGEHGIPTTEQMNRRPNRKNKEETEHELEEEGGVLVGSGHLVLESLSLRSDICVSELHPLIYNEVKE